MSRGAGFLQGVIRDVPGCWEAGAAADSSLGGVACWHSWIVLLDSQKLQVARLPFRQHSCCFDFIFVPSPPPLDLAKPLISDLREPEEQPMQKPQGNPLVLSHTLPELLSKDTVQVELIPEKKGLFLKHVEYEVSSKVIYIYCLIAFKKKKKYAQP